MPHPTEVDMRFGPLLLIVLLAVVMWFGEWMQAPPAVQNDEVPDTAFSAKRAQAHVDIIASQPHPSGSVANAEVRDYLIKTLQGMGAEVEIQQRLQTYDYTPRAGRARFASVENVVARFPGRESGPALLLMAHYDSVPNGPGAGDNASGVAAELETVRALMASNLPMRNTLIVLFSDAEEVGLIGAQAFFGHHRWARQVGLVLNFDSRGSRGPVFMYETSEHNGALINALAQVAPSPSANSLIYSIFQKMPNFSDMSIATTAGKAGMNFAFIDGFHNYHNSTDTAERLSLESLQHMGSYALPLVRHFGEVELPLAQLPNRHYFNPFGHTFVNYPPWLDWIIWLLSTILLVFAGVRAHRQGAWTILQMLRGICCALLLVVGPALLVLLLDQLLDQAVSRPEVLSRHRSWFAAWALLATGIAVWMHGTLRTRLGWTTGLTGTFLLLGIALASGAGWPLWVAAICVGVLFTLLMRQPLVKEARIAGALWLLWLLALAALLQLPGGAHVLLWPLLAVAILQAWRWRHSNGQTAQSLAWILSGLPAAILLGATALNFDLFIGYSMPIVSIVPLLLLLLFYTPIIGSRSARVTGLSVALLGVAGLSWFTLTPPWTVDKPEPVSLFVLHNADQNRTYWASNDQHLTDWHRVFLGSDPLLDSSVLYEPDTPEQIWLSVLTDSIAVGAPHLELISSERGQLRVYLKPNRAGDTVTIWLKPGADLRGWKVDGQSLQFEREDSNNWRSLTGFAMPGGGVELTFDMGPNEALPELLLVGTHHGLPESSIWPPPGLEQIRNPYSFSTSTIAVRHIAIDDLFDKPRPIIR